MEEKKFEGKSKIIVNIENIHCGDCALNIERSVEHLPGVLSAEVSYVLSSATIYYDPHRVEEERIKKAITKPGYAVKRDLGRKNPYLLEGKKVFHLPMLLRSDPGLSWIFRWIGLGPSILPTALAIVSLILGGYPDREECHPDAPHPRLKCGYPGLHRCNFSHGSRCLSGSSRRSFSLCFWVNPWKGSLWEKPGRPLPP